jgi:alpha-tubulin suppressor-like RCC1 family protein
MDLSSIFQGSMNIVTGQLAGTADKNPTLSNAYISPLSLRYADWHAEPTTGTLYVTRAGQTPSTVSTDDGALRLQRPLSNLGAGNFATCALASAGGGVKCWGDNSFGTLGDGSTVAASATPVQVSGLTAGVASTTGGFAHHCALTTAGAVQCWGNNAHGELGATLAAGATVSSVPVQVAGLTSGVVAIAAGGHGAWGNGSDGSFTCALTTAGGVKCWGLNDYGQLGRGSSTGIGDYSATPADVTGLTSGVVAIAAGYRHACAVMATGRVKCWGDGEFGQTGDTTACDAWTDDRFSPVDVLGLNDALSIDAGNDHTCALTRTGVVKCWGDNGYGQVGNGAMGANVCGPSTAGVNLGSSAVSLSVGGQFTCAVLSGGTVKCWGRNHWGQLGDGTTTNRVAPVSVTGLTGVTAVESGDTHNCARLSAGNVKCWGSNAYGEIAQATGTMAMAPVDVASTVNNTGLIASQGSVLVARFTSDSTVVGGHVMPIPYSMTDTTGKQALVVTFDPLAVAAANFIEQYDAHIAACNATTSESMTETDQSSGKKLWACSNAAAKADYLAGMLDFVKGARHYLFGYDDGCIYDGTTCTTTKVDYANAHLPYTVWVPDYATFATYYTSVSDAVTAYNTSILGATATRLEKTLQMVNVAHFNTNQAIVTSTVTRSGAYGATCVNNDGFSTKLK